jgi:hypothetical protein
MPRRGVGRRVARVRTQDPAERLAVTGEFDLARTAPPDRTLAIPDERAPHLNRPGEFGDFLI